jgi:hypothetical protein
MPTYDVDVGGKTYEVDAPDPDTAWQWANSYANEQASAQPAPTPTGERTWGETVTDVGAGLVQGAGSLVSLPGQLYGLATGNFSPTGSLGLGQSISEAGEGMKSEGLKFREAESARAVEEAEKNGQLSAFATRFIETVTDPAQLTNFLATVVPQLILPAGAAKVVAGKVFASTLEKGMAAGLSQAAAKEAAQKAAISYGTAAAKGAGATMQGVKEAGSEMLEEAPGQAIQNLAMQQVDPTQSLMEGVGASAAQALIGGLGAGLALGAGPNAAEQEQTKLKAEQAAFEEERRSEIKRLQEDRDRAREGLGLNEDRPLALPAPALEADVEAEDRELVNPVGNIPKEELSPEVVKYIDTYRKENNLPRLNSYSIEDVRDAMTQVNPEGEQGALDSILAAKTGYTGEERYVADDVLNAATEKNVATDTQGFNDFLERTTGRNTLDGMSQPQLYSAFKALKDMKRDDTTEQLVLPEGTNAARFTTKQYNNAVKLANMAIEESGGTLGIDSLVTEIKEATNLETDRDALSILEAAIKNEDLNESRKPVYRTYKPDSTTPVATYDTSDKADTAAKKQGLNVQKETLRQITPKVKTAPKIRPSGLPAGYEVTESTLAETDVPAAYGISVEGEGKPLSTVKTEAEAPAKVARLQALRAKRADQMSANIGKANSAIDRGQANLDRLEADGKGGTEVYQKQQAKQASRVKTLGNRIKLFEDQKAKFLAPLQVKPMGKRTPTRSSYTVKKDGQSIGSFPTQQAAEESVISQLADTELEALSAGEVSRVSNRAAVELETRKSGRTGIPVKGTKERLEKAGVETADFQEKVKALKEQLVPMLAKFGLKDVALKIVRQVAGGKADGSYSGLDNLIEIAMSADKPIRTMRHEVIHALRGLGFFTPQQWGALQRQAKQTWIPKYLAGRTAEIDGKIMTRLEAYQQMGLSEIDIIEEAIADAFADFDVNNKAPAGLLQALFKRLQNFFKALRSAFGGAGFESAEEIFGKIERGEMIPRGKPAETIGERLSLLREAYPDETEISTQNPQGIKRIYDPITQMLSIDEAAVREAMKANPDMAKRTIQAIKAYGFIPKGTPNNKVLEVFKQNIVNNLMFLYRSVPERIRQRSKLWYDGANKIATQMANQFDVTMEQVAGIMSAMSPQKDWFQNVSMAERALDILTMHGDKAWDENMLKYARSYVAEATDRKEREKRQDAFEKIKAVAEKGTTLDKMDVKEAAAFIRAYDEAYHSRNYRIVTPEGGFGDLVRNLDGKPSTMMWSTYGPIEKTVSIYRDGSRKNISQQLGFEHKIRSFYNNIAAPNSDISHVTIDTHAVAAGLFEALAGTDPEVAQNFGATGSSDVIGVGGTYGLIADAYREAAQKAGIRAREMQSITWEAVRGLFTEEMKSSIKPKIRAEWAKYKNGEQSFDETRQNVIEIAGGFTDPDWVGSGVGSFVEDGGTSYDKSFVPEGGVRLREAKELREKLTFNLSAVTNSIPGLRELYQRAMGKDKKAYEVLQKVAESSLSYLLSGTNARVNVEYAKGVYLSDREPSISVQVSFNETESPQVLAALAKFAESYNQQQIHVRQPTIRKPGHEFADGSYATVVYQIPLKKELNNVRISEIIEQSGLAGFTVTPDTLTAYWVKGDDNAESSFDSFEKQIIQVNGLVAAKNSKPKQTVERLYVYGEGYGARIGYSQITGDVRPKQSSDTVTPRIIAEYLTGKPVTTFKQKPLTQPQVKEQELFADVFDELPTNDLKNPLVKKAYKALAKALEEQFSVLPIKVELVNSTAEPYRNSTEMRQDVSRNNRFRVYKTTPETFGPPGSDFRGHPLLQDSGFTDINDEPMLYNDLLRAVHDYFAHNLSETEFGPRGEAAAWRNHMATTNDPLARLALTMETRAQNAWQNFRRGAQDLTLMQRGFADQKASLPPVNFLLTGDAEIDAPMIDYIGTLNLQEKLGSLSPDSALAKKVMAKMPIESNVGKLSLKTHFSTPEAAERAAYKKAAPVTKAFKQWFGGSSVVEEGRPKVMFHASPNEFEQFSTFKPIFVSEDASSSEYFASLKRLGKKSGRNYIYPLWVRAETPWDFENKEHVAIVRQAMIDSPLIGEKFAFSEDRISSGDWSAIEDPFVIQTMKENGFDSFYVKEGELKNLAVFGANQVKSITGNEGDFSLELKNMRFSLRTSDEPMTKDNVVAAMEFAQTKQPYTNCKLCTQLATGVPDLLSLPKVQQAKIGDIYTFNEKKNMASHYAVDVGNGDAVEVEGWGERVRVVPLSDITAEYDQPSAIRRPPVSAYTAEKYSLPFVSSQADARVNATTQPRENEGWVTRLMNITSPESRSNLRAGLINRYNQLSIYDRMLAEKMGGVELMADQRSESAALFSDLSAGVVASALGVGARRGGVPIYKGGFTTVDTSTKGLIEILSPLALYGDPKVYQYYQYWSAVKRGTRLLSEGRERLIEEGDRVYAAELQKQFPEFVSVQKDFNEFNNGLMAYAVATDVISKEAAAEYTKYADYVPFFRQLDGEQTVGPRVFNAISGVKPPRKLKGGEAPLSDFLENSVRNVQAIVNAGMKNSAGIKAVDVAMQLGTDVGAEELSQQSSAPNTVTVLKKGKPVSYQVGDQLFIDAVKSLNMAEIPFIGFLSKPSEVLRNLVTRDPGFMFANLLRDSLSAYVTSGVSMTPVVGTMVGFAKALAGTNQTIEELFNAGAIGGYEFSANVEASGERLSKDLHRKYGSKTVSDRVLRPFTWLWEGLEKGTTASDAATRTLIYDRVLAETGNEMEALSRALEVMNFNRRGSSTLIRILTASVPFLNARIQGLDLFYRASSGAMNTNDAKQIQKAFWVRGLTMMALSAMYFMAVSGDDEYKKQEQETKDNNWIVPYFNIKLPIPFEVGTLFKTMPERIIAYLFGEDTNKDFLEAMQRALLNTFAFNPTPQAIKPILETVVNYNFFTTRPLISQGMEDVAPEYQYTPGTSEVAKWLGKQIGVSPIKIDHVVRGYTGTLGGYAVSLTDAALETVGASTKASKTFVQLPLVKRFALDPDARGKVSDFYEIKNSVDQFVRTSNLLEKTMQPEEFKKFVSKNKGLYAVKDYVRDIEKSMKEMREMRTTVQNLNISPDSKRDLLVNIGKRENNLVANIQTVKQIASR